MCWKSLKSGKRLVHTGHSAKAIMAGVKREKVILPGVENGIAYTGETQQDLVG